MRPTSVLIMKFNIGSRTLLWATKVGLHEDNIVYFQSCEKHTAYILLIGTLYYVECLFWKHHVEGFSAKKYC